jgi:hypothetical protein
VAEPCGRLHDDPLSTTIGVLSDIRVDEAERPEKNCQRQNGGQHSREAAKKKTPEIL